VTVTTGAGPRSGLKRGPGDPPRGGARGPEDPGGTPWHSGSSRRADFQRAKFGRATGRPGFRPPHGGGGPLGFAGGPFAGRFVGRTFTRSWRVLRPGAMEVSGAVRAPPGHPGRHASHMGRLGSGGRPRRLGSFEGGGRGGAARFCFRGAPTFATPRGAARFGRPRGGKPSAGTGGLEKLPGARLFGAAAAPGPGWQAGASGGGGGRPGTAQPDMDSEGWCVRPLRGSSGEWDWDIRAGRTDLGPGFRGGRGSPAVGWQPRGGRGGPAGAASTGGARPGGRGRGPAPSPPPAGRAGPPRTPRFEGRGVRSFSPAPFFFRGGARGFPKPRGAGGACGAPRCSSRESRGRAATSGLPVGGGGLGART